MYLNFIKNILLSCMKTKFKHLVEIYLAYIILNVFYCEFIMFTCLPEELQKKFRI